MRLATLFFSGLLLAGCTPDNAAPSPANQGPAGAPVETETLQAPLIPPGAQVLLDDQERQLVALTHRFGEELIVVVVNWSHEAQGLRIEAPVPGQYELVQATTDEPYRVQTDQTGIILEIGGRTTLVLRRMEESSGPDNGHAAPPPSYD